MVERYLLKIAVELLDEAYSFIVDHSWSGCSCNRCKWARRYNALKKTLREGGDTATEQTKGGEETLTIYHKT